MCRTVVFIAAALIGHTAQAQLAAPDVPLVSPIRSTLAVLDAAGSPVTRATPGAVAVLRLVVANASTGEPERLDNVRAFIRVLGGEAADCPARVRIFRATGTVATMDYALQGTQILSLSVDNRLSLVDPTRPDARNTLAIRSLPEGRFRLVHDAARVRYYLQDEIERRAFHIRLPDLSLSEIGAGRGGHLHLDEVGAVLIGETETFRVASGGSLEAMAWPEGPWSLAVSGRVPVMTSPDGRWLAVPATRAERARSVTGLAGARALAASADGAVLVTTSGDVVSVYATATGARSDVPIGRPAVAAWFASDGRYLLALHADGHTLAVVDTATAKLVQAVVMRRRVSDITFVGAIGFVQTEDAMVFRFSETSLMEGRALELTPATAQVAGATVPAPVELPRLSPMADGGGVLASGPTADRIARLMIDDHPALNGAPPPVAPTSLRTGRSVALASVSRGFNSQVAGTYEASFLPRAPGDHLLVLADAEGRFAACHRISVGDEDPRREAERTARLVLDRGRSVLSGGAMSRVVFVVESSQTPVTPHHAPLEIMDLTSHWRGAARADRQDDGSFVAHIRFPRPGSYVIQPRVSAVSTAFTKPLSVTIPSEEAVR